MRIAFALTMALLASTVGAVDTLYAEEENWTESLFERTFCTLEDWQCSSWSSCNADGLQHRTCQSLRPCTVIDVKPTEQRFCTPDCTDDIWNCTDFNTCFNGQRTRTCSLQFDCPAVETPKPPERQDCISVCQEDRWSCSPWNECSTDSRQNRVCRLIEDCPHVETPPPETTQFCTPTCNQYNCSDWSMCQSDGFERRACSLQSDCFDDSEPAPLTERVCLGLRCGYHATMEERIRCRLQLSESKKIEEKNILPIPEHCIVLQSKPLQHWCAGVDTSLKECLQETDYSQRLSCARSALSLQSFTIEKQRCGNQADPIEAKHCNRTLFRKVRLFTLFTFMDVEQKVQQLYSEDRLPLDRALDYLIFLETQKRVVHTIDHTSVLRVLVESVQEQWYTLQQSL